MEVTQKNRFPNIIELLPFKNLVVLAVHLKRHLKKLTEIFYMCKTG